MKRFFLAVLFLLSGAADAAYPEKPINLVVAYSPGGGTDLIARAIAHRPGAGGEIGFAAIATIGAINIGEAQQSIRGGAPMRNIGQFSPARTTVAPELPTAREQGYDIELSSLRKQAEVGFRQLWKELPWGDK